MNSAPITDSRNLHCFTRPMDVTSVAAIVLKTWEARQRAQSKAAHYQQPASTWLPLAVGQNWSRAAPYLDSSRSFAALVE